MRVEQQRGEDRRRGKRDRLAAAGVAMLKAMAAKDLAILLDYGNLDILPGDHDPTWTPYRAALRQCLDDLNRQT
jgi:hypothetical protein